MTPLPTKDELRSRPVFDAAAGTVHVKDLLKMGHWCKNRLSDHWVGVLVIGAFLKVITKKNGDMFESDFVAGLKIRRTRERLGQASSLAWVQTTMSYGA